MEFKPLAEEELLLIELGKPIYFSLFVDDNVSFRYDLKDNLVHNISQSNGGITGFTKADIFQMLRGDVFYGLFGVRYRIHSFFWSDEEIVDYQKNVLQKTTDYFKL